MTNKINAKHNNNQQSSKRKMTHSFAPTHIIPPNFLCPMTLQVMRDPVMDSDGHNFEKTAILERIERGEGNIGIGICPISHIPLHQCDLISNTTLKETIRRWSRKHRYTHLLRGDMMDAHQSQMTASSIASAASNDNEHNDDDSSKITSASQDNMEGMADSTCFEDCLELGGAIKSLSTVLSAKEDYAVEGKDDISSTPSIAQEYDEEGAVQVGLSGNDTITESLLLNMFLPQEREAMAAAHGRAQERKDAERVVSFARASMTISTVVVSLLFLFFFLLSRIPACSGLFSTK